MTKFSDKLFYNRDLLQNNKMNVLKKNVFERIVYKFFPFYVFMK